MEETETTEKVESKPFLRRGEDFEALYANSVIFQPSEWDLRLVFGELDNESDDTIFIQQHTSIAVPWLQAKIMHYFLTLQLGMYEKSHQPIAVPESLMPPDANPPEGAFKDDPQAKEVYDYIKKMRAEFVSHTGHFSGMD